MFRVGEVRGRNDFREVLVSECRCYKDPPLLLGYWGFRVGEVRVWGLGTRV